MPASARRIGGAAARCGRDHGRHDCGRAIRCAAARWRSSPDCSDDRRKPRTDPPALRRHLHVRRRRASFRPAPRGPRLWRGAFRDKGRFSGFMDQFSGAARDRRLRRAHRIRRPISQSAWARSDEPPPASAHVVCDPSFSATRHLPNARFALHGGRMEEPRPPQGARHEYRHPAQRLERQSSRLDPEPSCLQFGQDARSRARSRTGAWRCPMPCATGSSRRGSPPPAGPTTAGAKRVYYLSMEFLIGRLLEDAIVNLRLVDQARDGASTELGLDYRHRARGRTRRGARQWRSRSAGGLFPGIAVDPRLSRPMATASATSTACSASPSSTGARSRRPRPGCCKRHAWEFERPEARYTIGFGGEVREERRQESSGPRRRRSAPRPIDTPIVGWKGRWANTLRLWSAKAVAVRSTSTASTAATLPRAAAARGAGPHDHAACSTPTTPPSRARSCG